MSHLVIMPGIRAVHPLVLTVAVEKLLYECPIAPIRSNLCRLPCFRHLRRRQLIFLKTRYSMGIPHPKRERVGGFDSSPALSECPRAEESCLMILKQCERHLARMQRSIRVWCIQISQTQLCQRAIEHPSEIPNVDDWRHDTSVFVQVRGTQVLRAVHCNKSAVRNFGAEIGISE